ncbi:MAG: DUF1294 domain-containing protein [Dehalococcoidia bacterium]
MTHNRLPNQPRANADGRTRRHGSPYRRYGLIAVIAAVGLAGVAVWILGLPWLLTWLLAMGAVTFGLYAWDKIRARADGGRVPEAVLIVSVLAGGVVGGWAGMLFLRHKTRHRSFWVVQWIATVLWTVATVWLVVR